MFYDSQDYTYAQQETLDAFESLYPTLEAGCIYCLFTGAPIAELTHDDFILMLDLLRGTPKERAAELATRTLMAARPSTIWNYVRESDLEILRSRRPVHTLAYLFNGARGLDKNKSGYEDMMLNRIAQFLRLADLDEDQLESAYIDYHLEAARKAEEESRAARRLRAWLEANNATGRQAAHRRAIEHLESVADAMRLRREADAKRAQRKPSAAQVKRAQRKQFMAGLINELFDDESDLLKPVDAVLTQPEPAAPAKPAFRIAFARKES